jgi:glycosyltransferase involved in cell wall biosynthesis
LPQTNDGPATQPFSAAGLDVPAPIEPRAVSQMRIAMVARSYLETDARVRRAVEVLTGEGHHVDVFGLAEPGTPTVVRQGNNRLIRLRMSRARGGATRYALKYGSFFVWVSLALTFFHLRRRYDVVYVNNMPNFLVFAAAFPKASGARIILDVRDPVLELLTSIRGTKQSPWLLRLVRAEERASLSFADAAITVNEPMRRRVVAACRDRIPVSVVMNLPDPATFVVPEPAREEPDIHRLVYSGTIAERHGVDLVLRALALLADDLPTLQLRLIGEGPEVDRLLTLARDLGVIDRVEFLGLVPFDGLPSYLQGASAGLSPLRADAFGSLVFSVKVAEYVHLGVPVICARTETMRHYFDEDEVMFFEPDDVSDLARAIRVMVSDPAVGKGRSVRSRRKLDQLDWLRQRETLVRAVTASAGP